jgi:hypothetical protein
VIYDHQVTTTEDSIRISHTEDESKQNHKRTGSIKLQKNKRQVIFYSFLLLQDSSIDSTAHNQILKQQKQLNGRNHQIPIDINIECQWTQLPHQKTPFGKLN